MAEMYEVEKVIGRKTVNSKLLYRVKWRGYPLEQSTWECVSHLRYVQDLIDDYEKQQNEKTKENSPNQRNSIERDSPQTAKGTSKGESVQQEKRQLESEKEKERSPPKNENKRKIVTKESSKPNEKKNRKKKEKNELKNNIEEESQINHKDKPHQPIQEDESSTESDLEKVSLEDQPAKIARQNKEGNDTSKATLSKQKSAIKIRLLQSDQSASEMREYLVEYQNGELKVLTTVEMAIAYPFEFIEYLEKKVRPKH